MAKLLAAFFVIVIISPSAFAVDSTDFNPVPIEVKAKGVGGVPVGTIIAWPVATNPEDMDKWLECNGQAVNPTAYPELFALIGGNTPDYRGLFLRGHGAQASTHYGAVTHQSAALGELQGDAIRNITGHLGYLTDTTDDNPIERSFSGVFYYYHGGGRQDIRAGDDRARLSGGFDASRVVPTSNENRPVNRAVRYLIRSLP